MTIDVALRRAASAVVDIKTAMRKVSFATRSEAGRYAANQRWKGNVKDKVAGKAKETKTVKPSGGDSTVALDKIFFVGGDRLKTNPKIQKLMDEMRAEQIAAGGTYGDNALELVAKHQGFDGEPKLVGTVDDLLEVQKRDGGTLVYRGVGNYSAEAVLRARGDLPNQPEEAKVTLSAEQVSNTFKEGDYYGGWGMFGNGTYATVGLDGASWYARNRDPSEGKMGNGQIIAMLIPTSAKMPSEAVVREVHDAVLKHLRGLDPHDGSMWRTHRGNLGSALAAMGYQAYNPGFLQQDRTGNFVILDRSMLTVSKEDIK